MLPGAAGGGGAQLGAARATVLHSWPGAKVTTTREVLELLSSSGPDSCSWCLAALLSTLRPGWQEPGEELAVARLPATAGWMRDLRGPGGGQRLGCRLQEADCPVEELYRAGHGLQL